MLQKTSWLCRSLLPHGDGGVCVTVPASVVEDCDLDTGDSVDLEYDRRDGELRIHLPEDD